jgi:hypothetical protein
VPSHAGTIAGFKIMPVDNLFSRDIMNPDLFKPQHPPFNFRSNSMIDKNAEQMIQSWKNLDIRSACEIHPSGVVEMDQDEFEGIAGGLQDPNTFRTDGSASDRATIC